LSVEEQFYLVFPLILIACKHRSKAFLLIAAAALCVVCWIGVGIVENAYPNATFYWAFARAWELGLGFVTMLCAHRYKSTVPAKKAISSVGLILLVGVLAFGDSTDNAFIRLFACFGTAMVLFGTELETVPVAKLLAWRPLVLVGLISYSLYLWHWPCLVLTQYYFARPLDTVESFAVLGVVVVLSILSWRLIEQPFRNGFPMRTGSLIALGSGVSFAVCLAGLALVFFNGIPERLSNPAQRALMAVADAEQRYVPNCEVAPSDIMSIGQCKVGQGLGSPTFLLWGDSHAEALGPAFEAAPLSRRGVLATKSACPPLIDVRRVDLPSSHQCREFNDAVLTYLQVHPEITTVILAARWSVNANGTRYKNEPGGEILLADDALVATQAADNFEIFERGLNRSVEALRKLSRQVLIVGPIPEVGWRVPTVIARQTMSGQIFDISPSRLEFDVRQAAVMRKFDALQASSAATIVHPHLLLCGEAVCDLTRDMVVLYSDTDHLSKAGAELVAPIFASVE
jgi:hypothetical protein